MATYYFDGATGNDTTGDGTTSLPYATASKCFNVGGLTNTIAYGAGTRVNNDVVTSLSSPSGCELRQWPGQAQCWLIPGTVQATFTDATTHWTKALAAGLNIKSVAIDWMASTDSNGNHYGHLQRVANAATVATTDDSWNYNSGTGVLAIRIGANLDPAGFTIWTLTGNVQVVFMTGATNCVIDGITVGPCPDANQATGYGIWVDGTGNRIMNCATWDCGYHSIGLVGNAAGSVITNNTVSNCTCRGIAGNSGGVHVVTYNHTNNTQNIRWYDVTCHNYTLLGRTLSAGVAQPIALPDNAASFSPAWTSLQAAAAYNHSNSGTNVRDIKYVRLISNHYPTYSPTVTVVNDMSGTNMPTPSDLNDINLRGVIYEDCEVRTGSQTYLNGATHYCGYLRCKFQWTDQKVARISTSQGRIANSSGAADSLFVSCVFIDNLSPTDTPATATHMFRLGTSLQVVRLINCAIIDAGADKQATRSLFRTVVAGAKIIARGTVFAFGTSSTNNRVCIADSKTITAISAAASAVVTSASHGFQNGDTIDIVGTNSTPTIDGRRVVASVTTNTFELNPAVDTTGGAGTTGTCSEVTRKDFYGNSYWQCGTAAGGYSDYAGHNSDTDWLTLDTIGRIETALPFVSASDLRLNQGHPLYPTRLPLTVTPVATTGFGGTRGDRSYGAYQLGVFPRERGSGRVRGWFVRGAGV